MPEPEAALLTRSCLLHGNILLGGVSKDQGEVKKKKKKKISTFCSLP
jgi:hypothetical protein